jgi:hypothetical protein
MLRKANWMFIVAVLATGLISSQQQAEGQQGSSPAPKSGNTPGGTNPSTANPGGANPGSTQGTTPGNNPGGTNPSATPGNNNPGSTSPGNMSPGNTIPAGTPRNSAGTNPGGFNPATTSPGGANPGGFNPATTSPGGANPGPAGANPNLQKYGANTPPPTMQGGPTLGQNAWFGNPNVQQQLNLGNNQFSQLNQAYGNTFNAYQQAIAGLDKSLTPQQRSQRMQELQQNFYKSYADSTSKIIPDPQMRSRYEQLHLQYRGVDAFNNPIIQNKLLLTEAQRQQFSNFNSEWLNNMGALHREYQTDPQGAAKQFDNLYRQDLERMYKALTPQQRQLWNQMRGESYDFQPIGSQSYASFMGQ